MSSLNFTAAPAAVAATGTDKARVWSKYQEAIFNFAEYGEGNAIVEAVAGSGKSTTLEEMIRRMSGSAVYLAFNKPIADSFQARGLNARTFHSIGYGPTLQSRKQRQADGDKLFKLCGQIFNGEQVATYGAFVRRLVSLGKQSGIGCLIQDTEQAWADIIAHHDLQLDRDYARMEVAIEMARQLLSESVRSPVVDFDDMLYLPVLEGLTLPTFDVVCIDEAQDTNAIQRAFLRKMMHQGTRIIAVGDACQAIYGFRGSDSDSLDLIAQEFNCVRLPLTVTYRCPLSVVAYAQQWVSHIEAAPGAPEGEVRDLGSKWGTDVFAADDLVVCRTTKPLIQLAYRMIRDRKPVRVQGREIGAGLKSLINKMNAYTLDTLEDKLCNYRDREVQKAVAKGDEGKAQSIADKVDCLVFMIGTLREGDGIRDLMQVIDSLFSDNCAGATVLATIHKCKGLQSRRVFWLNSSKCPSQWARQPWMQQQETNLCYVASTRAMEELILIEDDIA